VLWHYRHCCKLSKVLIECEGALDAESLHHNAAGTVGETPLFVGEALKRRPGVGKVLFVDSDDLREGAVNHFASKCEGVLIFASRAKKGQRLIHDIVGCDETFPNRRQELFGLLVVNISRRGSRIPRTGINEDHGAP